jgi:glycosidase
MNRLTLQSGAKNSVRRFYTALLLVSLLCLNSAAHAQGGDPAGESRKPLQWFRGGVVYEVFPRNFSTDGNLAGITKRLDELKDLGVTVLWLMPIHPTGEKFRKGDFGNPYWVKDFTAVDPAYGTVDDFKGLISAAHNLHIRVIMDLPAGQTAWDSVMMDHPQFYKQDAAHNILPPLPEWPDAAGLNYANPELRQYMLDVMRRWVLEYEVDGFFCDAAYLVPTDFWEQAHAELAQIKPEILMIADASKPELLKGAFDADCAWPSLGALNDILLNGAPASSLRAAWEDNQRLFPPGSLHLRITDDHDEARAVSRFGVQGALAASVLTFCLDGVPLIYNGMEVGDATESGDTAMFEKRPILWSPKERPPLRSIYRNLIKIRRQHPAFQSPAVGWLHNSNEKDVVSFIRSDDKEEFAVVVNLSNRPARAKVDVKTADEFNPLTFSGIAQAPDRDFPDMNLKGFEWRIYQRSYTLSEAKSHATNTINAAAVH